MAKYSEPVISRETRLLLTTVVVSVLALWLLARIRFQERPITADPVPPVLAQLRPQSSFDDLARIVAEIRPSIAALVLVLDGRYPALRVREDAAVTLAPVDAASRSAFDGPTGLAVVRTASDDSPGLMPWAPRVLDYPRYLVAAEITKDKFALRPVFVGGLFAAPSTLWGGDLWRLPEGTGVRPGTFLFTTEGAFAGMAVRQVEDMAIVPATHLLRTVDRLLREGRREAGEVGVSVQPLTAALAAATGSAAGMVVTAVDPEGPAAAALAVTDVIEAINGENVPTFDHWRVRVGRLSAGDTLQLRIRRAGSVQEVQVTAAASADASSAAPGTGAESRPSRPLGLRLRSLPEIGAEIVAVEPLSSAAAAGLQPRDVITVAGQQRHPTAVQVARAFQDLDGDRPLVVAVTRGAEHHVLALSK